jgi:hypothetical protein
MRQCEGASVRSAAESLEQARWAFKLGAEVMILLQLLRLPLLLHPHNAYKFYTQERYFLHDMVN